MVGTQTPAPKDNSNPNLDFVTGAIARGGKPGGALPAKIFQCGLRAAVDVKLVIDRADIRPHGLKTDVQQVCNFLVGVTLGQGSQHLLFALGQSLNFRRALHGRWSLATFLKVSDDTAG